VRPFMCAASWQSLINKHESRSCCRRHGESVTKRHCVAQFVTAQLYSHINDMYGTEILHLLLPGPAVSWLTY
jgi:hypothetical protein